MGQFINIGNAAFREARRGEYVDKSGLISVVNETLDSKRKFSCVSRARRFGKSMAAEMLCAYYDESCDSRELFADLEIARDASFETHLNKYPVIYLDLSGFMMSIHDEGIVRLMESALKKDIREAYPEVETYAEESLMQCLLRIATNRGQTFIFIIDEWDAICREYLPGSSAMDQYVNWLRSMFKDVNAARVFSAVYMTGILPIKKYATQSALNNFQEYSMVEPRRMARYFGFTKKEVHTLALTHSMDFDELEKWYDGYRIGDECSIFNPNSVMQALDAGRCRSFWASTGAYDTVSNYIKMNYEGLQDDIISMLAGEKVKVNPTMFRNDMAEVTSKDDVLTVLIHLGYLSYDWQTSMCYLPNLEVSMEMENAIRANNWKPVITAIEASDRLLQSLLRGNAEAVASGVEAVHRQEVSLFKYNDENSMACVISLAFYAARNDFHVHREYQIGDGYADLVLIPRKNVAKPAVIIELKYAHTTDTAIAQIKQKHYPEKIQEYTGDILLVGISYDRETKQHACQIERYVKD